MQAVGHRIGGVLLSEAERTAVFVHSFEPVEAAEETLFLRYALVTQGPEDHIFPALLLDDWGREIGGLRLYEWIQENGEQFPRAEVFGFEADGRETQLFLRELELYARLPCYAYPAREVGVADGTLVEAMLMPVPDLKAPRRADAPEDAPPPLRAARVTWWQVPPDPSSFRFAELDVEPDPGY